MLRGGLALSLILVVLLLGCTSSTTEEGTQLSVNSLQAYSGGCSLKDADDTSKSCLMINVHIDNSGNQDRDLGPTYWSAVDAGGRIQEPNEYAGEPEIAAGFSTDSTLYFEARNDSKLQQIRYEPIGDKITVDLPNYVSVEYDPAIEFTVVSAEGEGNCNQSCTHTITLRAYNNHTRGLFLKEPGWWDTSSYSYELREITGSRKVEPGESGRVTLNWTQNHGQEPIPKINYRDKAWMIRPIEIPLPDY